jgi:signal transduction histidine kinase
VNVDKLNAGTPDRSIWTRQEIQGLVRVSRAVALHTEIRSLLDMLAEEARTVIHSDAVSILLNEARGGFALVASRGLSDDYKGFLRGDFVNFGRSVSRAAADQLEPMVIDDLPNNPILDRHPSDELLDSMRREGFTALIAVPLTAGSRNLGVLNLYRTRKSRWTRAEVELASVFSQHAADAIDSARLLDSHRRQVESLERLVRVLRDQTHEYANRLHALSGLLAVGENRKAQQFLAQLMALHHENYAAIVDRVHDPMLAGLLVAQMSLGRQRGVDVRLHRTTHVAALPSRSGRPELITIVSNLIQNAIEATVSQPPSRRRVSVRITQSAREVRVTVRDWGSGIDLESAGPIFDRGVSCKEGHAGLGLALIDEAVSAVNGEISVRSEAAGTTFRVVLPLG